MFRIAIALLLAAPLVGQGASVTSYGTPCPNPDPHGILNTQGLPRLGATFTVTGINSQLLTFGSRPPPGCVVIGFGPKFLVLSFTRGSGTVPGGMSGHGCPILARPDFLLVGDANTEVNLQIPNRTHLLRLRFYLQSASARWCDGNFSGVQLSDGLECVIGT